MVWERTTQELLGGSVFTLNDIRKAQGLQETSDKISPVLTKGPTNWYSNQNWRRVDME